MTFSELRAHLTELELIDGVIGTLGWDEQTYMPKAAAARKTPRSCGCYRNGSASALWARMKISELTARPKSRWRSPF